MVIGGAWAYLHTRSFVEKAERADGTVVELIERDGDGGTAYAPAYTFTDASGAEHKAYSTVSSYPPQYEVGEKVQVLYDPDKPKHAKICAYFELWGLATVLAALGGLNCIMGPVFIYIGRRMRRAGNKALDQP